MKIRYLKPYAAGLVLFLTMVLAVAGCTPLNTHPVDKHHYDLLPDPHPSLDRHLNTGAPLVVRAFGIAPVFGSHAFVYRISRDRYTADYYNEFIRYPSKLITDKFTSRLYATPLFSPVQASRQTGTRYRLSGKITELYGDYRVREHPKAVMSVRLVLEKRTNRHFDVIQSRTYDAAVDMPAMTQEDLVSGWNTGLEDIITRFTDDVARMAK